MCAWSGRANAVVGSSFQLLGVCGLLGGLEVICWVIGSAEGRSCGFVWIRLDDLRLRLDTFHC